jgi:hypothetical protein
MKVSQDTMNQAIDLTKATIATGPKCYSDHAQVIIFVCTIAKTIADIKEDR